MVRGMYMSAMGMLNDMFKLDTIANNLANVDTAGYKKDRLAFKTYLDGIMCAVVPDPAKGRKLEPLGRLEGAVVLDEVRVDLSKGSYVRTSNPYDLAIAGEGFFAVEKDGRIFYTRAGNFKRRFDGYLVTNDGGFVLDESYNRIRIDDGTVIGNDGGVYSDGQLVTKIGVFNFKEPEKLEKFGYTYFFETPESGRAEKVENVGLMVGYIEKSNVNALREMVNMINALRHFEISQRVVTTSDQLLGRLFNNVATLR